MKKFSAILSVLSVTLLLIASIGFLINAVLEHSFVYLVISFLCTRVASIEIKFWDITEE